MPPFKTYVVVALGLLIAFGIVIIVLTSLIKSDTAKNNNGSDGITYCKDGDQLLIQLVTPTSNNRPLTIQTEASSETTGTGLHPESILAHVTFPCLKMHGGFSLMVRVVCTETANNNVMTWLLQSSGYSDVNTYDLTLDPYTPVDTLRTGNLSVVVPDPTLSTQGGSLVIKTSNNAPAGIWTAFITMQSTSVI